MPVVDLAIAPLAAPKGAAHNGSCRRRRRRSLPSTPRRYHRRRRPHRASEGRLPSFASAGRRVGTMRAPGRRLLRRLAAPTSAAAPGRGDSAAASAVGAAAATNGCHHTCMRDFVPASHRRHARGHNVGTDAVTRPRREPPSRASRLPSRVREATEVLLVAIAHAARMRPRVSGWKLWVVEAVVVFRGKLGGPFASVNGAPKSACTTFCVCGSGQPFLSGAGCPQGGELRQCVPKLVVWDARDVGNVSWTWRCSCPYCSALTSLPRYLHSQSSHVLTPHSLGPPASLPARACSIGFVHLFLGSSRVNLCTGRSGRSEKILCNALVRCIGTPESTANNVAFRKYCIHVSNVAQRGISMQKTAHAAM